MLELELVKQVEAADAPEISVNFGVMGMAYDLRRTMRGVKTAPRDPVSMWVYRPQDTFVMGYIAYADFTDAGNLEKRYSVFSPNITNNKYHHGKRTHMSSTLHRDKAVKNAAKYLRPLTTGQVLQQVQRAFSDKAYEASVNARGEARDAVSEFNQSLFDLNSYRKPKKSPLHNELKHLIQSGYSFLDKDLEANLRSAFTAMDVFEESKDTHDKPSMFVEAYQSGDQTRFRGFDKVPTSRSLAADYGETFDYAQGELPEHMAGGVSVLSMVNVGRYVAGVGYRAAENIFYVKCE